MRINGKQKFPRNCFFKKKKNIGESGRRGRRLQDGSRTDTHHKKKSPMEEIF